VFSFTAPPITVFISGIVGLKISPIASLATLPTSLSIVGNCSIYNLCSKNNEQDWKKKKVLFYSSIIYKFSSITWCIFNLFRKLLYYFVFHVL
jgi:hypothetical protein